MLTDGCKYAVGRLRPFFIEVCQPEFDRTLCENSTFIENYECTGTNVDGILEARKSFFSGHAAHSMTAAVFLSVRSLVFPVI